MTFFGLSGGLLLTVLIATYIAGGGHFPVWLARLRIALFLGFAAFCLGALLVGFLEAPAW